MTILTDFRKNGGNRYESAPTKYLLSRDKIALYIVTLGPGVKRHALYCHRAVQMCSTCRFN